MPKQVSGLQGRFRVVVELNNLVLDAIWLLRYKAAGCTLTQRYRWDVGGSVVGPCC